MAQHFLQQPSVVRLPLLLQELRTGELRIPPFQRHFEWQSEQRLHLFDSLRKGLPSGSVMVWRTTRTLQSDATLGPLTTDFPEVGAGVVRQYLLDGRQRLTTLFAALAPALWTREEQPLPIPWDERAPDDAPWRVFFDLNREEFTFADADEEGPPHLPLSRLFDDFAFDEWLRDHGGANREHWRRARALKSAVNDYLIPVLPLVTDDLDMVTLTFKRVNRAGTPMGDLSMTRALTWTHDGFDLQQQIDDIIAALAPAGWGELAGDTVLKVLALIVELEPTGIDVEKLARLVRGDPDVAMAELRSRLSSVVELLNGMGVAGPEALPYERAFVMAAWLLSDLDAPLDEEDKRRVQSWLARACIAEAFGNAPPHVFRALRVEAKRWFAGERRPRNAARRYTVRASRKFSMAWARSRVTAVAMAGLLPLRATGEPMFEDAQRALGERGNAVLCLLLEPNGAGLPSEVQAAAALLSSLHRGLACNRVLCEPQHLAALREALFGGEPRVCKSHAFPVDWEGSDLVQLLTKREELLKEAEVGWYVALGGAPAADWVRWGTEQELRLLR